jgi:hypothetical protein
VNRRRSSKKLGYCADRAARARGRCIGNPDISPSVNYEILSRRCRTLKAQRRGGVVYWNLCYAAGWSPSPRRTSCIGYPDTPGSIDGQADWKVQATTCKTNRGKRI